MTVGALGPGVLTAVCVLVWTCAGHGFGVGAPSCQGGVESPPQDRAH